MTNTKKNRQDEPKRRMQTVPVGRLLQRLITPAAKKQGFAETAILGDWPAIVGPELAARCRPMRITRRRGSSAGTLVIQASKLMALELQHASPQIIERINGYFGYPAVGTLRLIATRDLGTKGMVEESVCEPSEEQVRTVRQSTSTIENSALREAMTKLGCAVAARSAVTAKGVVVALLIAGLSACASTAPTSIQNDLLASAEARERRGDLAGASREYRELAEAGVVQAQFRLGLAYLDGSGVPHNVDAAVEWLSLAANAGDIDAMRELGDVYQDNETPVYDPPVAARWYATAAERGDEAARFALAELAIEEATSPADQQLAVEALKEGARNGFVRAQLRLADVYDRGKLVTRDKLEADRWYAIAANVLRIQASEGNSRAQRDLASLYIEGKGVPQDPAEAVRLLEESSSLGRLSSTIQLAKLYRTGVKGLEKDPSRAVYWRDQAVRRNHASSAYELGKWFMRGDGVEVDPIRSKTYFETAARLGENRALVYLGEIHGGKFDVLTNFETAARWYQQAGQTGDGKALFKLAELHERGRIGEGDSVRAVALYKAAAERGYSRGSSRADRLTKDLSDEQRAQAEEMKAQILANRS